MKFYESLSDNEKQHILQTEYVDNQLSFGIIAEKYNTYPNKLRRDAKKFSISPRSKSEAQKNALTKGRHKHPTKGKKRTEQEKYLIGKGVMKSWDNLSDSELENRKLKARENWNKLSDDEKENMLHKANMAVRESSVKGSKLEVHIMNNLMKDGYVVEFHKEQLLSNTKLQIDLFIPTMGVAIEIDGPSHFEPVWGSDALAKNKKYDEKKTGILLGKGLTLIRIKQTKDYSKTRGDLVYTELAKILDQIKNKQNTSNYIELGE
jgi:very-short-patch-repair endonuclease